MWMTSQEQGWTNNGLKNIVYVAEAQRKIPMNADMRKDQGTSIVEYPGK